MQTLVDMKNKSGKSIRAIARAAGLAVSVVHRTLGGRGNPTIETAQAIARALGVTLDEFYAAYEAQRRQ